SDDIVLSWFIEFSNLMTLPYMVSLRGTGGHSVRHAGNGRGACPYSLHPSQSAHSAIKNHNRIQQNAQQNTRRNLTLPESKTYNGNRVKNAHFYQAAHAGAL
ncbi:MAG: hypothetical protein RSC40_07945, partial [Clostridia bacterium]